MASFRSLQLELKIRNRMSQSARPKRLQKAFGELACNSYCKKKNWTQLCDKAEHRVFLAEIKYLVRWRRVLDREGRKWLQRMFDWLCFFLYRCMQCDRACKGCYQSNQIVKWEMRNEMIGARQVASIVNIVHQAVRRVYLIDIVTIL